jgi:hypothetical protein
MHTIRLLNIFVSHFHFHVKHKPLSSLSSSELLRTVQRSQQFSNRDNEKVNAGFVKTFNPSYLFCHKQ